MMNTKKLFIILCLLWLCPFIITAFFNQPAIDDYWNANAVKQYGTWGAVSYFCSTVSARYCSLFMMSVCNTLPRNSVWIFKIWPILIFLFLFFSVYYFHVSLFGKTGSKTKIASLSLLFIVLHIAAMRSLFEGVYWMSSTVCYQLAIALFGIAAGALLRDMKAPGTPVKITAFIATCLLPGTVELILPVYILLLVCLLYVAAKQKLDKSLLITCLVISLFFSFFILNGQGNLTRIENNHFLQTQSWYNAAYFSLRSAGYYTFLWLVNPLTLAALLLVSASKLSLPKNLTVTFTTGRYIAFLVSIPVVGIIIYFPLHLFESPVPFPRVTSLYFFFFFQLFIILHQSLFSYNPLQALLMRYLAKYKYAKPVLLAFFCLSAFTSSHFVSISNDLLTGVTQQYNRETYNRYTTIRQCTNDTCYLPPYHAWPLFVQSSREQPTDPVYFQHMNKYFRKTILLRKE